ncbi:hypothetical protein Talka_01049 [Tepidimonas alkaliphilus]|uniref:DUF4136 domain-containing protein n=1 Tax=Tepidimonas alkaliphilus TaxID=2588942 RepID=A0A554W9A9_9BURK|nr:hypothetical protein [Tepidimonas alkaliphilus]TSE20154.1 hypothetical protein Talka_01049 [Tepidimonas alkaliphilus]
MARTRMLWLLSFAVVAAWLAGCASTLRLEHSVQSVAAWPAATRPAAGDRYLFERLPSQRSGPSAREQDELEALAAEALATHGLQRADAAAEAVPWGVQLVARSVRYPYAPWDAPEPRPGWAPYGQVLVGRGVVSSLGLLWQVRPPYYVREVTLTVRDRRSGEVVYETRATQDGPWADSPTLWRALLQAALDGFPQPPTGPRRVVIEPPR